MGESESLPKFSSASAKVNRNFRYALLAFQILSLGLFIFMKDGHNGYENGAHKTNATYASFQDVHVMIFVGFGFLMTFLKDYNWSSMGFTMMIGAVCIQWAIIVHAWLFASGMITIDYEVLFGAEFACGAILISFGALLGKINHLQLLFMALMEVVIYKINELVVVDKIAHWLEGSFALQDIGGSMVIHAFGAYFGLAASKALYDKSKHANMEKEGSNYTTDLFAMIGTIFLWMFWPSFNSIPSTNEFEKQVVITNTYLSLAAAAVTTFAISGASDKLGRLDMVHIQNATLAGGVAMGSSAAMQISPAGAIFIGFAAGLISTMGYQYALDFVHEKLGIHDTCGVNNLHGIPGILGCLFSIGFGLMGCVWNYDHDKGIFAEGENPFSATYQFYALISTLFFSIVGGYVTGLVMDVLPGAEADGAEPFEDGEHWGKEE